jgi:deoxycytidine triphosphate deaminase
MTVMVDKDIRAMLSEDVASCTSEKLVISPFSEECLAPTGYYLRAGKRAFVSGVEVDLEKGKKILLKPHQSVVIYAMEHIQMPTSGKYCAIIQSKTSMIARGLSNVSTVVDYDWCGNLGIIIQNVVNKPVEISYGEKLCRIIFLDNSSVPGKRSLKNDDTVGEAVRNLSEVMKGTLARSRNTLLMTLLFVGVFSGSGFILYGNSPGWGVATALGVSVSQLVFIKRDR